MSQKLDLVRKNKNDKQSQKQFMLQCNIKIIKLWENCTNNIQLVGNSRLRKIYISDRQPHREQGNRYLKSK